MSISRRRFLGGSAALTTAAAVATATKAVIDKPQIVEACQSALSAPLEVIALSRLAFGLSPDDVAAFQTLGSTPDERLTAYVEQQLNPGIIGDSACDARLAAARLKIKYDAVNEARPPTTLTQQTAELWERAKHASQMNWAERIRPYNEVRAATWLRAVTVSVSSSRC